MNTFNHWLFSAVFLLLAASCTSEQEQPLPGKDPEGTDGDRQEIMLTLNNTLRIPGATTKATTKADGDPIATETENFISTLDVYVFASDDENSDNYTFQELFYFREDGSSVDKEWATRLNFTQTDEGRKASALLRVKKGLYIRTYCIANQTTLVKPGGDIYPVTDFLPLRQSEPGSPANTVTAGMPTEQEFLALRTPALSPDDKDGYLKTPLPMTGSNVTPMDLTDFSVSARQMMGFKMVRSVARFDVVNNAEASKFSLQSISMGKGIEGVTYFPVKAYSTNRVIYPATPFTAEMTADNDYTATGAFYSYPSPSADKAYLILKGIYAANKTENKQVTYQVPFERVVDGKGVFVDIQQNHRYTLYISDADEYHLDVDIRVSDWDDAGNIDDYKPDNVIRDEDISLIAPPASVNASYDNIACVVSLLQDATSKFVLKVRSNSTLTCEVNTPVGATAWIEKDDSYTGSVNEFAFKVVDGVETLPGNLPDLNLRLSNLASGKSKIVRVTRMPGPEVALSTADAAGNLNRYDASTRTITFYNTASQTVLLHAVGTDGQEVTPADVPAWLTVVAKSGVASAEDDFTVTYPTAQAETEGSFYFVSGGAKTVVKVKVKPITMNFAAFDYGASSLNTFDAATNTVELSAFSANRFSLSIRSPEGCDTPVIDWAADTPESAKWLSVSAGPDQALSDGSHQLTLTGSLPGLSPASGEEITVTIPNRIDPANKIVLTVKTKK